MDFFHSQETARKKTGLLVLYFTLAVVLIVLSIYALIVGLFVYSDSSGSPPGATPPSFWEQAWNPDLAVYVALGVLGVVSLGSLYKIAALSQGGAAVAEMVGGRLLDPDSREPQERQLLNVVEEMAIASGVTVPPVYLLDHETSINAFAAGFSPNNAVIGVTRGTMETLSRDELQGVIAHEFSHILNGDMRLNIRLMGIIHGILLIGIIGYFLLRSAAFSGSSRRSSSDKKGGGAIAILLLGVGLLAIGYIGTFFGKLIKAAVSRQREFLADASAVQFTRNPDGIGGALKRIGATVYGSRIENPHAEEASHMFFGSAVPSFMQLLATHPPLPVRIRKIDPSFDGDFDGYVSRHPVRRPEVTRPQPEAREGRRPGVPVGFPFPAAAAAAATSEAPVSLTPDDVVGSVGNVDPAHLAYASALLAELPDPVKEAAHSAFGARAVVYCLLLDDEREVRRQQQERLREHADPAVLEAVDELLPQVDGLDPRARLPLVEMSMSSLRGLAPPQYEAFRENLDHLVRADQKISLFEYALERMLTQHLAPHFEGGKRPRVKYHSITPLKGACRELLSTLAHVGHKDAGKAETAFRQAIGELPERASDLELLPSERCSLRTVDEALNLLTFASPAIKRSVLRAATTCISHDGKVTVAEGELLRAVADSLDCPMPPLLPGGNGGLA